MMMNSKLRTFILVIAIMNIVYSIYTIITITAIPTSLEIRVNHKYEYREPEDKYKDTSLTYQEKAYYEHLSNPKY
jgi:hypothetical protein